MKLPLTRLYSNRYRWVFPEHWEPLCLPVCECRRQLPVFVSSSWIRLVWQRTYLQRWDTAEHHRHIHWIYGRRPTKSTQCYSLSINEDEHTDFIRLPIFCPYRVFLKVSLIIVKYNLKHAIDDITVVTELVEHLCLRFSEFHSKCSNRPVCHPNLFIDTCSFQILTSAQLEPTTVHMSRPATTSKEASAACPSTALTTTRGCQIRELFFLPLN